MQTFLKVLKLVGFLANTENKTENNTLELLYFVNRLNAESTKNWIYVYEKKMSDNWSYHKMSTVKVVHRTFYFLNGNQS